MEYYSLSRLIQLHILEKKPKQIQWNCIAEFHAMCLVKIKKRLEHEDKILCLSFR